MVEKVASQILLIDSEINPADGYESKPNLDEEIVTYETKLKTEGVFCVLHILFTNRLTQEILCLHILFRILTLCKKDVCFLNYIMQLPAPNYTCAHYLSWVRPHLENILANPQKNYVNQTKEELTKQALALYTEIEDIVNKYANQKDQEKKEKSCEVSPSQDKPSDDVEEAKEEKCNEQAPQENSNKEEQKQNKDISEEKKDEQQKKRLRSLQPNYIIGTTQFVEEMMVMPIGEDQYENGVILRELEYTVLYTESKPTGSTNDIIPNEVKAGPIILLNSLNLIESNIHKFFFNSFAHHSQTQAVEDAFNYQTDSEMAQENHGDIRVVNLLRDIGEKEDITNLQKNGKNRPNPLLINIQRTGSNKNVKETANQSNLDNGGDNSDKESVDSNKACAGEDNSLSSNINSAASFFESMNPQQMLPSEDQANQDTDLGTKKLNDEEIVAKASKSDSHQEGKNDEKKVEEISKNDNENELANNSNSEKVVVANQQTHISVASDQSQTSTQIGIAQNKLEIPIAPPILHPISPIPLENSNPNLDGQNSDQTVKITVKLEESQGPVVRRYVIDNSSESVVRVVIDFSSEAKHLSGSPFNQCMPQQVSAEIQPNSSHAIFSMKKVDPNREWDKFAISAECFFLPSARQQQESSGAQPQQKESNSAQKSNPKSGDTDLGRTIEVPSGEDSNKIENIDENKLQQAPLFYTDNNGEKVCPACTLVNPSHRQFCEVCDSEL